MHRTGAAVLLIWAVVLAFCGFLAERGEAATAGFALRFEANTNGSILIRGNANLICPPADPDCVNGRAGSGTKLNDNDFPMVNANADNDPATFNDSTATVSLPPGSTVLFAGLYWSGDTTSAPSPANKNKVRFKTPSGTAWQPLTAATVYTTGTAYQGFSDVTAQVAGAGSGVYAVADIQAGLGLNRFAGWALAVAYRNPAEVLRALRVYDGLDTVSGSSGSLDIPVSGFEAPHSGAVRAEVGTVAYEGDLGTKGDALKLNGQAMSDAANPVDNFFNSTVSSGGAPVGGRDPGFVNLFGVDIDQFDATGKLAHAATSATLTLTTSGDQYYPGVVTFAIDLYAPKLVTTVAGTDLDGGDLLPGDLVEYRIDVRNDGNDIADGTVLSDAIPAFTTYVPGSMRVAGAPVADSISGGRIDVTLGDLPYLGATWVIFRVRVDPATPAGYAITNLVSLSYTGHTAGVGVSGLAGTAASVVAPAQSDLVAGLTVSPGVVQQGASPAVTYLATVTNSGASTEPAAYAELTLPAGATFGVLPAGCTSFGPVATCALGPLAPGSTATVAIPGVGLSGNLRAYGSNVDSAPGNNTTAASVTVNQAPIATGDPAAAPGIIPVLANDSDPEGGALTVSITVPPTHGTAIVLANGTISYTPAAGWAGDDPFTYTVTDPDGGTASAVVTVRTPNAPPLPIDDAAAVDTGGTVTVDVTANDSDPNGDPLTVTAVDDPGHGPVSIVGNKIVFAPAVTFVGAATFLYTVSDGQATATAHLVVNVANAAPTAANDVATVGYAGTTTIPVLLNDNDINGDHLTVVGVGTPARGTATFTGSAVTYQAAVGYSGTYAFGYTIDDGHSGTSTAQITVTVADAPPTAADIVTTTAYLTPVPIDPAALGTDPNVGDALFVSGASNPAHGTVVRETNGKLTYTPDAGWSGTDSFTYTLNDGQGGTDTATVTITVGNAPPTARPDTVTGPAGGSSTIDVLVNDDDPNGDPLTITIDLPASHGTATVSGGRVAYQPVAGYSGPDSLHYTIDDGHGGTSGATVTITLLNAAPTARPDTASTPTDTAVTIDPLGNDDDPNGDPVTLVSRTPATHGTLTAGAGGTVIYTPAAGFTGTDTFGYTITDSHGLFDSSIVTVVVRNAPPVAEDDTFLVQGEQSLNVVANDHDPNTGQALSVLSAGPAAHGTVVVDGPLTVRYTPAAGFTTDTFAYVLTDDLGGTDIATVTVGVDFPPLPLPPIARPDHALGLAGQPIDVDVLANDVSMVAGGLTITSVGTPIKGSAAAAGGKVRYAAPSGWSGEEIFRYVVTDARGSTAASTVTVTVGVPPGVPDKSLVTPPGQPVSVALPGIDGQGRPVAERRITQPAHGQARLNADGSVTYTPDPGFTGEDRFTYVIVDADGNVAEGMIVVIVPSDTSPSQSPSPSPPPSPTPSPSPSTSPSVPATTSPVPSRTPAHTPAPTLPTTSGPAPMLLFETSALLTLLGVALLAGGGRATAVRVNGPEKSGPGRHRRGGTRSSRPR
ncbi:Ig-like domain-containing protein [Actinoplanes sp. HUAS TT8]|uniref:Ig-like domain-containing protein n=1 Tax=Actinoplanes sp. HUAS TT8 TaxID=3447453 RepID=UPI003F528ABC